MKEIKAYIKPFKLDEVMRGLSAIEGLTGMSFNRVEGYGRGRGGDSATPLSGDDVRFVQHVKLELVVRDELAEQVVAMIQRHAHTGLRGDGKIYVLDVVEAVRISTGERGEAAV
ncbi:P-II family nitrogen regulator [bacterium]|nr:P-II family nitrogen regulator [bacterium]